MKKVFSVPVNSKSVSNFEILCAHDPILEGFSLGMLDFLRNRFWKNGKFSKEDLLHVREMAHEAGIFIKVVKDGDTASLRVIGFHNAAA